MEPLAQIEGVLMWFGVCPVKENEKPWKKFAYLIGSILLLGTNISAIIASVTFIVNNASTDLEGSLYAFLQTNAASSVSNSLLASLFFRHKLAKALRKLREFYKTYAEDDSFEFLAQAKEKCDWTLQIFWKFVLAPFLMSNGSLCSLSVYIFWLNIDKKYLYRMHRIALPWDQNTLLGHAGEKCFDIMIGTDYVFTNGTILVLFISFCLHNDAFCSMFQHKLNSLKSTDNPADTTKKFCKLIHFQNTIKDLFIDQTEFYSSIILVLLICSMFYMAGAVFQIDLQLKHIDLSICILLMAACFSSSTLFVYCLFGKLSTDRFEDISDDMYGFEWSNLPLKLQKYFILMIGNAQQPIYFHGFDIAYLELETFTKLLKAVYTYYMLFKTITTKY